MIKPKAFTISEPRNISLNLIGVSYYDKTDPPFSTNYRFNLTFYTLIFNILDARMNNQTIDASGTPAELDKKYSFQVEVENTGEEALNPNLMSRMYVVLYDAGFEMDRANISYLKSGESKTVVFAWYASTPGPHKLMFQLEGDLPLSERGRIVDEYNVIVKYDHDIPEEEDTISLMDFMPQIILMVIFGLGIFIFLYMFNKIFISAIDTGYDEDGTYRPWAVREKIKDDNRLDAMPVRPQLPSPAPLAASRQLPPSPATSPVTPTTTASPVAASPYQPRPAAPAQAMPIRPMPQAQPTPAQARPTTPMQPMAVRPMPQAQPTPAQARPATPMQPMAVPKPMPAQAQPVASRPAGPIPTAQPPRPLQAQPSAPPAPRPPQPAAPRAPPVPPNQPKPPQ
jgi:hypothetical protein